MPKLDEKVKPGPKAVKDEAPEAKAVPAPQQQRLETIGLEDVDETLNALWYGEGGTGKTTAIASMANEGKVLYINSEAGLKRRPLLEHGVDIENIQIFPNPKSKNEADRELTFDRLEQLYWQLKEDLEEDPNSWAGTCWDSVTEIVKKLLEQIVEYQLKKAARAGKDRDRFFIDRADYGVMTEQVRLLLRRFRDLPCHFAVTALERRDQDDDQKVSYGPAVTPALQSDLIGYVDVVVRTSVDGDGYWGQTRPAGKYRAKDRFGVLPPMMPTPSFKRVLSYINDEIDESSDPLMQAVEERRKEDAKAAAESAAS